MKEKNKKKSVPKSTHRQKNTKSVHLNQESKSVGIIGAGWYGIHLARSLKRSGFNVVLYDKNKDILSGVSGTFGIRTHTTGMHYPRSSQSRLKCKKSFESFASFYPELLVKTKYSIHALMGDDLYGNPSKVGVDEFSSVCREDSTSRRFDSAAFGFDGLQDAVTIDEPSILVGEPLREIMRGYLVNEDIPVICNYSVQELVSSENSVTVVGASGLSSTFDHVINATGFQKFLPDNFNENPFGMAVRYQPCVGLIYEDMQPDDGPFMFLGLDGAHWAAMPCGENEYVITHGIFTILGSCEDVSQAHMMLRRAEEITSFMEQKVKKPSEEDISRSLPGFCTRFKYKGWKGDVLAKPLTEKEFRCALTFSCDNTIHVIPGKISNVMLVEKEVKALIAKQGCSSRSGYTYVDDGVLIEASEEVKERPTGKLHNTCLLNPHPELCTSSPTATIDLTRLSLFSQQQPSVCKDLGKDLGTDHSVFSSP